MLLLGDHPGGESFVPAALEELRGKAKQTPASDVVHLVVEEARRVEGAQQPAREQFSQAGDSVTEIAVLPQILVRLDSSH
ncbi:hypothetical protein XF35_39510 [Streptomyces platensis subsp. clarensis]|nr:hypothetical protein [Streptomyces platensis subsp. clarensis]